ncbi:hypothetical protein J6590_070052 [Homalodisca vitripennis]|nr:hypothetical protein J6590_070052 [Homalodisca vitripennis]
MFRIRSGEGLYNSEAAATAMEHAVTAGVTDACRGIHLLVPENALIEVQGI